MRLKKCLTGATLLEMDVKRPARAVEELHQIAATRTERRLFAQVDFRREMRPIAFVDPAAFVGTNPENAANLHIAFCSGESQRLSGADFPNEDFGPASISCSEHVNSRPVPNLPSRQDYR